MSRQSELSLWFSIQSNWFGVLSQYQVDILPVKNFTAWQLFTLSIAYAGLRTNLSITLPAGVKYSCFIESGSDLSGFCYSEWIIDKNGALFLCNCYQCYQSIRSDCICQARTLVAVSQYKSLYHLVLFAKLIWLKWLKDEKHQLKKINTQKSVEYNIFLWDSLKWLNCMCNSIRHSSFRFFLLPVSIY